MMKAVKVKAVKPPAPSGKSARDSRAAPRGLAVEMSVTLGLSREQFRNLPITDSKYNAVFGDPAWNRGYWEAAGPLFPALTMPEQTQAAAAAAAEREHYGVNEGVSWVSYLLGSTAESSDGTVLGKVEDVLLPENASRVAYAIVTLDKLKHPKAGMAVVPWAAIRFQRPTAIAPFVANIRASTATIEQNAFSKGRRPDLEGHQFAEKVCRDYGVRPHWEGGNPAVLVYAPEHEYVPARNQNNGGGLKNPVAPSPDLTVTAVTGPTQIALDGLGTVTVTVENAGTAFSGAFDLGIYLSTDRIWDYGDTLVATAVVPSIAPGGSKHWQVPLSLSTVNGLSAGTYYWIAYADPSKHVAESNENNNTLADSTPVVVHGTF